MDKKETQRRIVSMFKKYDYYISELINAQGQPIINDVVANNIRNDAYNILVELFNAYNA